MRRKNSFKNMIASIFSNVITIGIGLVAQAAFIKTLGTEYLGLNGLFTNIISMLAIVELGVGNAIIYNLYKPIAENNIEKIKSLMSFYRKSYRIIGLIVFVIGIIIVPFLTFIIGEINININIVLVFLLFLLDVVFSYFLSYKRSILYANQKNYLINIIHIFYTIFLNLLQILILFLTKNYYLYLFIKIFMRIIENLLITIVANIKYQYLKEKSIVFLDQSTKNDIIKKTKALFLHKIGSFVVLGTDNIIISKFLGLISVGLYSNYYMIFNAVQTIFGQMIQATTASVGHLLVTESKEKQFDVFKKIRFINFWIACFSSTAILVIMDNFVIIWLGKEYLLTISVLIVLVLNSFQKLMRNSYVVFKDAAGIYFEDRFVPIIESLLNIVFSIFLVKKFGLVGVFIGTTISGLALWCYSYPKFVYKKLFDRNYWNYFKETFGFIILFICIASVTYGLTFIYASTNIWLQFLFNTFIGVFAPNLILALIFCKSTNFKYYLNILKKKREKNIC